jgi:hypothetical protein
VKYEQINSDEELRLRDICDKIRALEVERISKRSLLKAHDIITGGAVCKAKKDPVGFICSELEKITSDPPMSRGYLVKLERVYRVLKSR